MQELSGLSQLDFAQILTDRGSRAQLWRQSECDAVLGRVSDTDHDQRVDRLGEDG